MARRKKLSTTEPDKLREVLMLISPELFGLIFLYTEDCPAIYAFLFYLCEIGWSNSYRFEAVMSLYIKPLEVWQAPDQKIYYNHANVRSKLFLDAFLVRDNNCQIVIIEHGDNVGIISYFGVLDRADLKSLTYTNLERVSKKAATKRNGVILPGFTIDNSISWCDGYSHGTWPKGAEFPKPMYHTPKETGGFHSSLPKGSVPADERYMQFYKMFLWLLQLAHKFIKQDITKPAFLEDQVELMRQIREVQRIIPAYRLITSASE